jgi:hypothetical protein
MPLREINVLHGMSATEIASMHNAARFVPSIETVSMLIEGMHIKHLQARNFRSGPQIFLGELDARPSNMPICGKRNADAVASVDVNFIDEQTAGAEHAWIIATELN